MLKLIKNEYAKIFRKIGTYVLLGLCLLFSIGINIIIQIDYDSYYDDFYSKAGESLEELIKFYESEENLIATLYAKEFRILIDMGYTYDMQAPEWVSRGVSDVVNNHMVFQIVKSADDSVKEDFLNIYGIDMDEIDIDTDYENKMAEDKLKCIKAFDYKGYSQKCMEYLDYQNKLTAPYEGDFVMYGYEYHKYIVDKDINPDKDKDKMTLLYVLSDAKDEYDNLLEKAENGEAVSQFALEEKRESYEVYKYIIDNDINCYLTDGYEIEENYDIQNSKFITSLTSNTIVASIAGIFVMIIAAGIIANEFTDGTIKFLLINPVKRAKIFWSKYVTCISLLIISMLTFFVIHLLFCIIVCGADGLSGVYISYSNGLVREQSIITYSFIQYLLSGVSLVLSVTFAFAISSLARNNAIAVALSLSIEILGTTMTMFLSDLGHDWGRYLLFANTDTANILKGNVLFPGQTIGFSLCVIFVYYVIFILMAYDGFKKKDV